MFTGIVEELGSVAALDVRDRHATLEVACTTVVEDVAIGDSIAVNGCCLTVTEIVCTDDTTGFRADLMAETLRATSLGDLAVGSPVNLERAMAAGGRLGGHLVQGHVDAVGEVVARDEQPGTVFLTFAAPAEVAPYLVAKGSVTIDGTSLTVVDVEHGADRSARFRVGLIPHTLEVTTFGSRAVGDRVNLEADVIAKYVERLLAAGAPSPYAPDPADH
ncbi:MAG: riboflavin synthase [Actinomycetes bacterium]